MCEGMFGRIDRAAGTLPINQALESEQSPAERPVSHDVGVCGSLEVSLFPGCNAL